MKRGATLLVLLIGLVLGIEGVMALSTSTPTAGAAHGVANLNETTIQLYPVADAYVSEVAPTTNFGTDTKPDVQNLDTPPPFWPDPYEPNEGFAPPPFCPDPYEPNESFAQAWPLSSPTLQSYICCDWKDADYFTFSANSGDLIQLGLSDLPANYDVCLYDPAQKQMACSTNSGTADEFIRETAHASGDHYALIRGVLGTCSSSKPYNFKWKVTPPTPTCPDVYEPNETFTEAYVLHPLDPVGYYAYICTAPDEDYFQFQATLQDMITVVLDQLPRNYDLELWTPDETLVAWSRNDGGIREEIHYLSVQYSGPFRVRVMGVDGAHHIERPYHLRIHVESTIPTPPPPLVVNTTDDVDDGTCDAVHCSLREAIDGVNVGPSQQIEFDMPDTDPGFDGLAWAIQPSAPLPTITERVSLDATTQTAHEGDTNPDGPEIVLDGSLAGSGANGLALDDLIISEIKGLAIMNWSEAAVRAEECRLLDILGCYIGTDPAGETAAGNHDGIVIVGGNSAHIGGSGAGEGNLISGNTRYGLHLSGTHLAYVRANLIGTDRTGMADLGNALYGIYLSDGTHQSWLGGDRDSEGNLISGNDRHGIYISGAHSSEIEVLGNRIGVNRTVTDTLLNLGDGIYISGGYRNTIGEDAPGQGNIIGGHIGAGGGRGITLGDADLNTVAGNFIGTYGGLDLGNNGSGVLILGDSRGNTIGPGNVIRCNDGDGVEISGEDATGNTITRNSITNNGGQGIDNVSGGNEELVPPIITAATTGYVQGSACPGCRVEIFADPAGEGEIYDGAVTAAASGEWTWHGTPSLGPDNVTAAATDDDGNTSEFSACSDEYEPNDDFDQAIEISDGDEIASYICHPDDLDYFRVSLPSLSEITAELVPPSHRTYMLALYDGARTLIDEVESTRSDTGTITYYTLAAGEVFIQVRGDGRYDPSTPYTLRVTVALLPTTIDVWIDEGWLADTQVYKLVPDADGPTSVNFVDITMDVTAPTGDRLGANVALTIPGDAFGPPLSVEHRYCTGCSSSSATWSDEGAGRYESSMTLLPMHRAVSHGQLVFHFAIPSGLSPDMVVPSAEVSYTYEGSPITTASGPAIALVDYVPAIITTNRHHLYDTAHYVLADAVDLLGQVTQAAQGPASGLAGSQLAAIYYVDDYSTDVRDWDNLAFDATNESTANEVPDIIDRLIEDWVEDAGGDVSYLLILGDDELIPFGRRTDRCRGDDSEAAHPDDGTCPALHRVVSNDFYLTDNWYADTDHSGPAEGELELNVGRIVGDTAADMLSLFQGGLLAPSYGSSPRAVLASWDHFDLHFAAATYASVLLHVRDWGFSASDDMVDNEDWRKGDLLSALGTQYGLLITGNHGDPYHTTAPPDYEDIFGWEIARVISATAPTRMPFYGFGDCRVGFTLVNGGLIDRLIPEGASGFVAGAGITWGMPSGSENYTEEVFNNFWRRALNDDGTERSVGSVLRSAKADYSAGAVWSCRDEKGVMQLILFGLPWMPIPAIDRSASSLSGMQVAPQGGRRSPPHASSDESFVITATVDASNYTVVPAPSGFQLVEVDGFEQRWLEGPLLPSQELVFPIPPGGALTGVGAQFGSETSLGAVNIPTYIHGVAIDPGGTPHQWLDTPPEVGIIPTEPYTYEVKDVGSHQVTHVHLIPLVYDAASDQATLYQQITLTVSYTTPVRLAITDLHLDASHYAPGEPVTAQAEVINVSDAPAAFTTTLSLVNVYGDEVSVTPGGPFTVSAGASEVIRPPCLAPDDEGTCHVQLTLWQDGTAVAQASDIAQVVAFQIVGFDGPDALMPGHRATFSVTLANHSASAVETGFALELTTEWGQPVAALTSPTQTVPAGSEMTVAFAWDSADASPGRYEATALVTPAGRHSRSLSRLLRVHQPVYLPLILKTAQARQFEEPRPVSRIAGITTPALAPWACNAAVQMPPLSKTKGPAVHTCWPSRVPGLPRQVVRTPLAVTLHPVHG